MIARADPAVGHRGAFGTARSTAEPGGKARATGDKRYVSRDSEGKFEDMGEPNDLEPASDASPEEYGVWPHEVPAVV